MRKRRNGLDFTENWTGSRPILKGKSKAGHAFKRPAYMW
ncbi:hypothetical protein D068_cds30710 [Bacillus atrophaeus UCMB-5137]|nr:hypothetical protein D068_cds30710 [Bacillus atrophaeus UCMB-5137]